MKWFNHAKYEGKQLVRRIFSVMIEINSVEFHQFFFTTELNKLNAFNTLSDMGVSRCKFNSFSVSSAKNHY